MSRFDGTFKAITVPTPVPLRMPKLPDIVAPAEDFARHVLEELRTFDETLDQEHEAAVCLAAFGQSMVIHVEKIIARGSFFIVFRGRMNDGGEPVTLIQHLAQANLLLVSAERLDPTAPKRPIGFAVEPAPAEG